MNPRHVLSLVFAGIFLAVSILASGHIGVTVLALLAAGTVAGNTVLSIHANNNPKIRDDRIELRDARKAAAEFKDESAESWQANERVAAAEKRLRWWQRIDIEMAA